MKLTLILALGLPVLGIGAGYGAGLQFAGNAPSAAAEPGDTSAKAPKASEAPIDHDPATRLIDAASKRTGKELGSRPAGKAPPLNAALNGAERVGDGTVLTQPYSGHVVKLGSMMVPVYKPRSVTYVVADFGVSMPDAETAAHYRIAENAARLRDSILSAFHQAADNPRMKRAALDSDWLSSKLTSDLQSEFTEAQEVLFLSLYKRDVPRS